jgi:hypothetical protein
VRVLGLDDSGGDDTVLGSPAPVSPLPTTALPDPDDTSSPDAEESDDTDDDGYGDATGRPGDEKTGGDRDNEPGDRSNRGFELNATPAVAGPMERVNLTGTYAGQDNVALQVQRLENGTWATFPVTARVSMGTFETYVQTSQRGDNKFRVYDPDADKASNVVTITIR